jgi:hypothetical protein
MGIVIGITGTREGATPAQLAELRSHIAQIYAYNGVNATVLHHGDCVGVDKQAHDIALEYDMLIEVHPPTSGVHRAFTAGWSKLHKPLPYRLRNEQIVARCDVLLAVPDGPESQRPKSGTWMTVRMARRANKTLHIIRAGRW